MSKHRFSSLEKRIMTRVREEALANNLRCPCCGCVLDEYNISVDHIQPKCLGYDITETSNYQVLCTDCNNRKGMLSINYNTATFIIEPYMFLLTEQQLINLLITGDPNNSLNKRDKRISIKQLRRKLAKKFIVK